MTRRNKKMTATQFIWLFRMFGNGREPTANTVYAGSELESMISADGCIFAAQLFVSDEGNPTYLVCGKFLSTATLVQMRAALEASQEIFG